jgi:hypothetical protein
VASHKEEKENHRAMRHLKSHESDEVAMSSYKEKHPNEVHVAISRYKEKNPDEV